MRRIDLVLHVAAVARGSIFFHQGLRHDRKMMMLHLVTFLGCFYLSFAAHLTRNMLHDIKESLIPYREVPLATLTEQIGLLMAVYDANEVFIRKAFTRQGGILHHLACLAHTINESNLCIHLHFAIRRAQSTWEDFFQISCKDDSFLVEFNYPQITFRQLVQVYKNPSNFMLHQYAGNCPATPKSDLFIQCLQYELPDLEYALPRLDLVRFPLLPLQPLTIINDSAQNIKRLMALTGLNQRSAKIFYQGSAELCRVMMQNECGFGRALHAEASRLGMGLDRFIERHRLNFVYGDSMTGESVAFQIMALINNQELFEEAAHQNCHLGYDSAEYKQTLHVLYAKVKEDYLPVHMKEKMSFRYILN